jgi:hypothetical protein
MPSGKAILAGLLALLVLGGGVAAVVFAGSADEDQPSQLSELAVGEPEDDGEAPAETEAPSGAQDPELGASDGGGSVGDEPEAGSGGPGGGGQSGNSGGAKAEPNGEPAPPSGAPPRKTTFKREVRKDPSKRGGSFSVPPAQRFTGSGNALIGTVDVTAPAIVKWRTRGGNFGLEFGREAFPIIAPSRSGQLVIPPFRFELVRVLADGRWTITVTPQG